MNSPADLAAKLAKQWHNPQWRVQRLLSPDAWPLELAIGRPSAEQFSNQPAGVLRHIQRWRTVTIGEVDWDERKFRDAGEAVSLPIRWRLRKPSEWIQATGDAQVESDYALLSRLIGAADPLFRALLIQQLPRIRNQPEAEILRTAQIASSLEPGCAQGKPLRALAIAGSDSKFFERNRHLLVRMLDLRFAEEVSELGLEAFLGATSDNDHWLLLAPLQDGLLPFRQLRVRASELEQTPLPASYVLVIENERCIHQLPQLPDCIAILGAGLNLSWMQADWLGERHLAYWGDLDTWGLAMLSNARGFQPRLRALLMDRQVFDQNEDKSVAEPVPYRAGDPPGLTPDELSLFQHLSKKEKGRLEQEFLPTDLVHQAIREWANS